MQAKCILLDVLRAVQEHWLIKLTKHSVFYQNEMTNTTSVEMISSLMDWKKINLEFSLFNIFVNIIYVGFLTALRLK